MYPARTLLALLLLSALAALPTAAQTVIDFESVPSCDNVRPNMGVHEGVDFLDQWTCYGFPQSPFTPSSGSNRIYAHDGGDYLPSAFFEFVDGPTVFQGAYFAGTSDTDVFFRMFLSGTLVGTSSSLVLSSTPMFLTSGHAGAVDRVEVVGSNPGLWVLDDLTYGTDDAVGVAPEPATMLLLGSGLLGLGTIAARRRRHGMTE